MFDFDLFLLQFRNNTHLVDFGFFKCLSKKPLCNLISHKGGRLSGTYPGGVCNQPPPPAPNKKIIRGSCNISCISTQLARELQNYELIIRAIQLTRRDVEENMKMAMQNTKWLPVQSRAAFWASRRRELDGFDVLSRTSNIFASYCTLESDPKINI